MPRQRLGPEGWYTVETDEERERRERTSPAPGILKCGNCGCFIAGAPKESVPGASSEPAIFGKQRNISCGKPECVRGVTYLNHILKWGWLFIEADALRVKEYRA